MGIGMMYRLIAASIALIITYSLIALRGVSRRIDVPAWVAMLIGASIMIGTGVVTVSLEAVEVCCLHRLLLGGLPGPPHRSSSLPVARGSLPLRISETQGNC
ncbi:MAG: hypothetical protein RXR11_06440 [Caldivirga sp.]